MSTCRLGGQAATHPLRPSGETVEVQGLYVADGAAFPACSGVNPMLTIMALAHYLAQGLK
jgi:choline dehydrogenase-like flavoprotein